MRSRARPEGHLSAARVPPLLPGRRSDRASDRLHRRGRRRPGRRRARLPDAARGKPGSRRVHQGPPGAHRRGRRSRSARRRTGAISRCRSTASCRASLSASCKAAVDAAPRQGRRADRRARRRRPAKCSRSSNVPSYNPNNRARLTGAQLRNRAITDLFEPGSTLKPFTVARGARERAASRPTPWCRPAPGTLTIGQPHHPRRASGGARMTWRRSSRSRPTSARPRLRSRCRARPCGTCSSASVSARRRSSGFRAPSRGKLRAYATWRPIEQATMAYGHGISVSLAAACARLHHVRERRRIGAADAGQTRRAGRAASA